MPTKTPKKRTAQIVPKKSTKRHAAIVKKVPATTLITGGTGFLGSHLVRQLVESGSKDIRVMATSIPEWLTGLGVDTFEGSITNEDDVSRAVEGVTEIYHLAGKVSRDKDDSREMYKLHVEGTRLLCDAAKKAGAKTIVLASSSGTIAVTEKGDIVPDENYNPPLDIVARWPYYASKAYQEMAALERFNGDGLRVVIMNPSLLLGPGDDRLSSTKVVLDFMARKISAVPNGGLNFVDVRDAAQAFRVAMQKGRQGERYILGCKNLMLKEVFDILSRLTGVKAPSLRLPRSLILPLAHVNQWMADMTGYPPRIPLEGVKMAKYRMHYDCSKALRELGIPQTPPEAALEKAVHWFRAHGYA